jgi:hypothetical protein
LAQGAWAAQGVDFTLEGVSDARLPASLEDGQGKVSVVRSGVAAAVKTEYVTVKFNARRDAYSWTDKDQLPFGNGRDAPWKALNRIGLGLVHSGSLSESWGYFASGDASVSYEKDIEGALGLSTTAGAIWRPSSEWSVKLGAGLVWHRIRSYPFPVIGLNYRSSAIKGLEAELGFPSSHLAYRFNEWVALRLTGDVEYGLYRLASDSDVQRKGYVELWGYSTGAWVEFNPVKSLALRVGCAWDFQGSIATYRDTGEKEKEYTREGAPRIGLMARYEF